MQIRSHLRRERNKLRGKPFLKNKATEFSLKIQNRYSVLEGDHLAIGKLTTSSNEITKEAALEKGGEDEKSKAPFLATFVQ